MRRTSLFVGLLVVWLSVSACSCGDLVSGLTGQKLRQRPSPSADATSRVRATVTQTAAPTRPATPKPTGSADRSATMLVPTPAGLQGGAAQRLPTLPTEPNTAFRMEVTEAQLNQYFADGYSQEDVSIRDVHVVLTEREVIATLHATYKATGLAAGITVRGTPTVSNGKVYFKVADVTLDESISGITRTFARSAIDNAIRQYSTADGIPVPIENIEFTRLQLAPGQVIIEGRTR